MESSSDERLKNPAPANSGARSEQEVEEQRKFRPLVYWYLTFRCNLACAHCWVGSSPTVDTSGDLGTVEAMGVVEQLAELNVEACLLSGGEVTTRRDALDIVEALGDNGVRAAVETNGLLISDRFLDIASRLQPRGKFSAGVSLDGGDADSHDRMRGTGTFRRTLANLHRLRDAGIRFSMQCVLNRSNVDTIPALYDVAAELSPGLVSLTFCLLNPLGRGEGLARELGLGFRDLDRILTLIQENRARFPGLTAFKAPPAAIPPRHLAMVFKDMSFAPRVSCHFPLLGILPNGDVTICALARDSGGLYFGNVRNIRLKDAWEKGRMDELRRRYVSASRLEGICGDCIWKRGCRGACRAWAHETGGSFDAPYPLCAALEEAGEFPRAYRISAQAMPAYAMAPGDCSLACPLQEIPS